MRRAALAVVVAGALMLGGCGDGEGESESGSTTTVSVTTEPAADRTPLEGFGEVTVTITDADGRTRTFCLLLAESDDQRARGLMEVTDPTLGGYDGMLFVFESEIDTGFYMRNTPMPLSIAYFAGDGSLVSTVDMEPCGDRSGCPTYPAEGPFQYAIEVVQGELGRLGIGPGALVEVGDTGTCPAPEAS